MAGTGLFSSLAAFAGPVVPYAGLCTAMVCLDCVSAVRLGLRLRSRGLGGGRLSSRRLSRTLATLVKVYVGLAVAAWVQAVLVRSEAFDALRFTAGAVCFWQLVSILENESTCSDARWARVARRYLADKARRHTGIDIDGE